MSSSDRLDDAMQDDASLVEMAKAGDQAAFAELYERYFDRVYDFLARMVHDPSEAADLTQDAFLKAMNSLGTLSKGTSFKSWLFTIARNTALNRLERASRTQPLEVTNDAGEEQRYDVIDEDRFGNPEEAAEASSLAGVVWEAAAALEPRYRSVLLLNLREGLDSAEIAEVMGVTKNHAYVLVNRMKAALESAVGAVALFRNGRRHCAELAAVIDRLQVAELSPEARRVIERHAGSCAACQEQRNRLASPFAIFAGMALMQPAAGVKEGILGRLEAAFSAMPSAGGPPAGTGQEPGPPAPEGSADGPQSSLNSSVSDDSAGFEAESTSGGAGGTGGSSRTAGGTDGHHPRRRRALALVALAGLLLLTGGPIAALAFFNGGDTRVSDLAVVQEDATATATSTNVPTTTPSPTATATSTPTAVAQAVVPTDTPTPQPSTPVPVAPGPSGPSIAPGGGSGGTGDAEGPMPGPDQPAPPQADEGAAPGITPDPSDAPPAGDDGDLEPPAPDDGDEPGEDSEPDESLVPEEEVEPDPEREREQPSITADSCTPSLSAGPSSLTFGPRSTRQTVVLKAEGCGDPLRFTAEPGETWLFAIPSSGSIPDGGSASVIVEADVDKGAGESGRVRIESIAGSIDILVEVEEAEEERDPIQSGDDLQQPCGVNCVKPTSTPPTLRSN